MNLHVLSNINFDPFKNEFLSSKIKNISLSGFNQYMYELIDPNSNLNKNFFDLVFFHLDGDELFNFSIENKEFIYNEGPSTQFIESLKIFSINNPKTNIIVSGISISSLTTYNHLNSFTNFSFSEIQFSINKKIINLSKDHLNLHYFDFPALVSKFGQSKLIDYKYWYLGRIKYSTFGTKVISKYFNSLTNSVFGLTKKVLVLDLDNTLWGGVIGEDGIDGIRLSEDGIGKVYRDFQEEILRLKSLGIILAISSKNNEADAKEAFDNHNMMLLKFDDFAVKKINWNNKSDNIRDIAKELNIGLDSIVFIDDNPVEREFVKESIPELSVPVFPLEIFMLKDWFINDVVYEYFPKISLTDEDIDKTNQYERNVKRVEQKSTFLNINDYINTLDIKIKINLNDKNNISRISQLTQKTNQFNLSTKRYSESEIENFMNDNTKFVFSTVYEDKFGNEGVVSVLIAELTSQTSICIDTFLMSCRVIGRNVEKTILKKTIDVLLKKHRIDTVNMIFNPTKKNILAQEFYKKCGFLKSSEKLKIKKLKTKLNE